VKRVRHGAATGVACNAPAQVVSDDMLSSVKRMTSANRPSIDPGWRVRQGLAERHVIVTSSDLKVSASCVRIRIEKRLAKRRQLVGLLATPLVSVTGQADDGRGAGQAGAEP
jgi:hypothetical protein